MMHNQHLHPRRSVGFLKEILCGTAVCKCVEHASARSFVLPVLWSKGYTTMLVTAIAIPHLTLVVSLSALCDH